jgi:hypothetical protein
MVPSQHATAIGTSIANETTKAGRLDVFDIRERFRRDKPVLQAIPKPRAPGFGRAR